MQLTQPWPVSATACSIMHGKVKHYLRNGYIIMYPNLIQLRSNYSGIAFVQSQSLSFGNQASSSYHESGDNETNSLNGYI